MAIVALASPARGSVRHVNCNVPGQTVTKALQTAQPGDTIRVQGTCEETVTITPKSGAENHGLEPAKDVTRTPMQWEALPKLNDYVAEGCKTG